MKTTYQTPSVSDLGTFEEITQGQTTGSRFDSNFTAGQTVPVQGRDEAFS